MAECFTALGGGCNRPEVGIGESDQSFLRFA